MSTSSKEQALDFSKKNRSQFLNGFLELLSIPSVSTDPAYKDDLEHCADWIVSELSRIGFQNSCKISTTGHPVVYSEWLGAGPEKPTILVYAHFDVQPVDPLEKWDTHPFHPTLRDGRLFSRGAIDDKCGVWINLKAFESILAIDKTLPVNIKLLFEGEEEVGSPSIESFLKEHRALLESDALVISDGPFDPDNLMIGSSGRGLVGATVKVTGPSHDLHSGDYGGAVHNPLQLAGQIIGSFHDIEGRVQIPDFYSKVQQLDEQEYETMLDSWAQIDEKWRSDAGVAHFWGSKLGPIPKRITALPALDVNGMWGGYGSPGLKTIIPAEAGFTVTMRLVPNQDPAEIYDLFREFVLSFACDTLTIEIEPLTRAWPFKLDYKHPIFEAKQRACEAVLGKRATKVIRSGSSGAIIGLFQQIMNVPITGLEFGSGGNVHAPNEYINLDHFYLGIELAIHFYYELSETMV